MDLFWFTVLLWICAIYYRRGCVSGVRLARVVVWAWRLLWISVGGVAILFDTLAR